MTDSNPMMETDREPTTKIDGFPPWPLHQYKVFLRQISQLMHKLTSDERRNYRDQLLGVILSILKTRLKDIKDQGIKFPIEKMLDKVFKDGDLLEGVDQLLAAVADYELTTYKNSRDAKPRWPERDKEIVRLRDQHELGSGPPLSFGRIARKLKRINPEWTRPTGETLSDGAVAKAYQRAKQKHPKPQE